MNFDELRDQWLKQNERLEKSIRLSAEILREAEARKAGGALGRLSRAIWIELVMNGVVVVLLGNFISDHLHAWQFLAPAIVLDLFAITLIGSSIRQLAAISQVEFEAPLLTSQKNLEALRIQRLRETKWVLLLSPLLWTPLLIVALEGFWGVDAYSAFPATWLVANVLIGVGLIPLLLWISSRFARRFARRPFLQRLMNDIAGRNLTAAQAYLDRLSNFESGAADPEL